jgi:hypothetical protein
VPASRIVEPLDVVNPATTREQSILGDASIGFLVRLGFGLSSLPLLLIEAVDQINPACWQRLSQDCIVLIAQGASDHFGKGELPHRALPWFEVSLRGVTAARLKGSVEIGVAAGAHGSISDPCWRPLNGHALSLRFHVLPFLLNRRPMLHPEFPVVAP